MNLKENDMDKTTQDLAWRCLPREFREEVKNVAQRYSYRALALFGKERQLANKFYDDFINLFGSHNLTSDAEGEEMLTVPRKRVEKIFIGQMNVQKCSPLETIIHCEAAAKTELLYTLFGSKCLPDNVDSLSQNPTENCDNKSHISTDCDKQAEPKFKPNDKVIFENVVCTIMQVCYEDSTYSLMKDETGAFVAWVAESNLEPYTEPTDFGKEVNFPTKNNLAIYLKKSKNCDNRLQIAAMAMQGILSNIDLFKNVLETGIETLSGDDISFRAVAKASLLFADALIAEVEKK